jgi:hypothetical protein
MGQNHFAISGRPAAGPPAANDGGTAILPRNSVVAKWRDKIFVSIPEGKREWEV